MNPSAAPPPAPPPSRQTWARFVRAIRQLGTSEVGWKANLLFAALIVFLVLINALNVVNSYVGRNFMTAIAHRDSAEFLGQALRYSGVFVASTVVAVLQRYAEERLCLLWREWLTRRLVTVYLRHPIYYRLSDHLLENGEIANPDQRIADDVKVFTQTTISFSLLLLNGAFTALAFSGVLWSISPALFGVAVAYATVGSLLTVMLGRRLIQLNSGQLDREAEFRAALVHLRENAESVALLRFESRLKQRILVPLAALIENFRHIIHVNVNLGLFTTGYNYFIQIIPALLVAPLFIRGEVEFGVITQSAMAFSALLGAFSLIVTQFQSISSFAAVISRLEALTEAAEQAQGAGASAIDIVRSQDSIEYRDLTLISPRDHKVLVRDLSVKIEPGTRLLVLGPDSPKVALVRATAGIWDSGSGTILCPDATSMLFVPERPYLPPGTLRELLTPDGRGPRPATELLEAALAAVGAGGFVARAGGLDVERHWDDLLSLGEQQLLNFARVVVAAPAFVILDRVATTLTADQVESLLGVLREHSVCYVHFAETDCRVVCYDAVLELEEDGTWQWRRTEDGQLRTVTPSVSTPESRSPSTSA